MGERWEKWERDGGEMGERWGRDGEEMGEMGGVNILYISGEFFI
jgi:hypothetical protein